MATARPEIATSEGVLNFYELQGDERTKFAIYAGHKIAPENCRFEFFGDDKNTGSAELIAICNAITANPANTNVYILQVLAEELPKAKVKNPNGSRSVTFQLNNPMPGYYPNQPGQPAAYIGSGIEAKLSAINERLDLLQSEEEEEDLPAVEQNPLLVILAGLFSNPDVQSKIVSGIMGAIENFGSKPAKTSHGQLSGIPKNRDFEAEIIKFEADILEIRKVLPDFDLIVAKLAEMARTAPNKLITISKML